MSIAGMPCTIEKKSEQGNCVSLPEESPPFWGEEQPFSRKANGWHNPKRFDRLFLGAYLP